MTNQPHRPRCRRKRTTTALLAGNLLLAAFAVMALAMPVEAHYCKATDHGGCDSHYCDPNSTVSHEHVHDVPRASDHYCRSHPTESAVRNGLGIESVGIGDVDFDVVYDLIGWSPEYCLGCTDFITNGIST